MNFYHANADHTLYPLGQDAKKELEAWLAKLGGKDGEVHTENIGGRSFEATFTSRGGNGTIKNIKRHGATVLVLEQLSL